MSKKSKIRCGRLIYFVLGLGIAVTNTANADPDLVGWWRLDEGSGTTAYDSSGKGRHGTLLGNPQWVIGKIGGALEFDGQGNDRVLLGSFDVTGNAISIACWFKADNLDTPGEDPRMVSKAIGGSNEEHWFMVSSSRQNNIKVLRFRLRTDGTTGEIKADTTTGTIELNEWIHVATTWDGVTMRIYKNGLEVGSLAKGGTLSTNPTANVAIGNQPTVGDDRPFDGIIDDVRIYTRALTPEEIEEVMKGILPGLASIPSPADGATDVSRDVVLSWTPGEFAPPVNGHKVYLSENFNDVNDGIGGIIQSATSYARPQRLDFSTTYYWRVDEVNAPPTSTVFEGGLWSFTTEPIAYPIENITATASSAHQADTGPENTINGSGLDANDLHSIEPTDMWLSSNEPNGAWIEYELDKVYKLHEMWIWNSNGMMEPMVGVGFKDVSIEYSVNGTDYTTLAGVPEFAQAPGVSDYEHNTTVDLGGAAAKYVRLTTNSNWGGMLDQYGLSEVRFFSIPVLAREPQPRSGATDVDVDVDLVLSFRAGRGAAEHNVYISTDEQAVIDSNVPVSIVTEAQHGPISLDLGKTYYWKVNEVNEAETPTTWQGDIWNFTTHEFFVVDDFEDYNDYPPDEIWSTWVDGYGVPENGATSGYPAPDFLAGEHYVETTIVHGGSQAMPFFYRNTGGAAYSEGERIFAVPQDWTKAGIQTLALYFHGTAGNTGQLYVKVNGTKVPYDGQASNLALAGWQAWNIELASFGTNLQSVTTLAIGIDDNGASGTLYFDDIRLYSYSRQFITPAEPDNAGLIGHWKFDGDTLDYSGLGNDGTADGDPTFVAGKVGSNAIELDGDDYVVIDAVADDFTNTDITLSAWVKTTDSGADWFSCNTGSSGNQVRLAIEGGKFGFDTDSEHALSTTTVSDGQWHLLTFVRSGNTGYTYVDGVMENSFEPAANDTSDFVASDLWSIGQEWDSGGPSGFLTGIVDDARIYDYALSLGEVAWLAGRTEPFDKPF